MGVRIIKQVQLAPEVKEVFDRITWSADGLKCYLPEEKLERTLYEKVNAALKKLGGKWSRRDVAHVFTRDPRPQIAGDTLAIEKDGFFETPPTVVDRMIELLPVPGKGMVLEPSAGLGAIVAVLRQHKLDLHIHCIERNHERCVELQKRFPGIVVFEEDFLETNPSSIGEYTAIYMNPPFEKGQDLMHIRHAYEFLAPGGILISIMACGALERNNQQTLTFNEWLKGKQVYNENLCRGVFTGTSVGAEILRINHGGKPGPQRQKTLDIREHMFVPQKDDRGGFEVLDLLREGKDEVVFRARSYEECEQWINKH